MESDRFDDVDFRVIEEPEPPPRRRGGRALLAASAFVVACGLGLGASALADSGSPPAAKPSFVGDKQLRHHGGCHHGFRQQGSSVRY